VLITLPPGVAIPAEPGSDRRATIAVQVHDRLRHWIIEGIFAPRQAVSEHELAAALGVSRTPVREALGKLEREGLVQIVPQYGTFIAPIRTDDVYASQFVREALECAALPEAVRRCTPNDARRLRLLVQHQREAESDAACFAADEAMHALLMSIAGQDRAWRIVQTARLHLDRVRRLAVRRPGRREAMLAEHAALVELVARGDAAGAVAAMRSHLRGAFEAIEPVMSEHPRYFSDAAEPRPARRGSAG
jgi:DNA-binding GntR family transcriptional regulator